MEGVSHLSNRWSYAAPFLVMRFGDIQLSTGSSFLWLRRDRTFLVTNWHNLAGRNPLTGQPMSRTGGIPDGITIHTFRQAGPEDEHGLFELEPTTVDIPLNSTVLGQAKWVEHPSLGRSVDVAAIDVTERIQGHLIEHVNVLEANAVLSAAASQDVFIIGYPFGQITGAPAPVWKRGTIALDPTFDPDGLPKMFVDTASREGMSGSVVVGRQVLINQQYKRKDGTQSAQVLLARIDTVIGIYSGRHYPDLEKAQLGVVWKRRVIEETVYAGRSPTL
ncbi:MAG: hypothetical protein V4864_02130 [Pseudomonadota bacterium]